MYAIELSLECYHTWCMVRTEIIGSFQDWISRARKKRDISFRLPVVRSTLRVRVERERVALRVVRKRHACAADALLP